MAAVEWAVTYNCLASSETTAFKAHLRTYTTSYVCTWNLGTLPSQCKRYSCTFPSVANAVETEVGNCPYYGCHKTFTCDSGFGLGAQGMSLKTESCGHVVPTTETYDITFWDGGSWSMAWAGTCLPITCTPPARPDANGHYIANGGVTCANMSTRRRMLSGTQCASEGGTCSCYGEVRYGSDSGWTAWSAVSGSIGCNNGVFGGDPSPGIGKTCECREGALRKLAVG